MAGEYRILALDGGGVRGIFTSRLIERLQTATNFLERIDLVAGTSTGGIIALALAAGISPPKITALYQKHAKAIFSSPIWRELQEGLLISKYTDDALRRALQGELGSRTLGDLTRHSVLIAAFDLDSEAKDEPRSWKPKFFHNLKNEDSDAKELAVEVALRTSAAPTYFPTADNFIDGGVAANNPAMAALALAVNPDPTHGVGKDVRQTRLLSLGTGRNCKFIAGDHDWGAVQWGKKLVDILIEGTSGVAEYECRAILGPRFLRLDPVLPDEVDLDDAARTGDLLRWADEARLDECIAWIQREMLAPPAA